MQRDPILIEIPDLIRTERLDILIPRAGDGKDVFEGVAESLDELRRFPASLPWAMAEPSIDASESFCRHAFASSIERKEFRYLLRERDSGEFIGCASLHRIDWSVPKCEVGFWCRTSMSGHGYVTEAVKALMEMAFELRHAERIEILADHENAGARLVCERAGFALEGIHRHNRRAPDGKLRDICVYARLP
jgi:RimJ/RimL family protein N-acetyltransferase